MWKEAQRFPRATCPLSLAEFDDTDAQFALAPPDVAAHVVLGMVFRHPVLSIHLFDALPFVTFDHLCSTLDFVFDVLF